MLAQLIQLDAPSKPYWSVSNMDLHRRSVNAVFATSGKQLAIYPLDPLPDNDMLSWLQLHQQMHNDLNAVIGVAGNDFSSVDFNNEEELQWWLHLHFVEHQQQAAKLGIQA